MIGFHNQLTKFIFFGVLSIPRGVYLTLSLIILPVYLYDHGISVEIVTLIVGILTLPWIIKFLFGGIIDHYSFYGRRIFVILGGVSSALSLFLLTFLDPSGSVLLLATLLLIGNCGLLFLDVAQAAWVIDITKKTERGKINGIMFGSYFLTMAICSSFSGWIAKNIGYISVFIISGIIILLISIFTMLFNEKEKTKNIDRTAVSFNQLKKDYIHLISVFALISSIGGGLLVLVAPLFMRISLNLDIASIGILSSFFLLSRAFGSVAGGTISDTYGRKKSLAAFIGSSIILAPFFIISKSFEAMGIIYTVFGFLLGSYHSITSTVFMDISKKERCATHYSIYASIFNMGRLLGEISAGLLIVTIGFSRIYLIIGWFSILTILILYFSRIE